MVLMRVTKLATLAALGIWAIVPAAMSEEFRIATWNLEHLAADDNEGCMGRSENDYAELAKRIEDLDAHIVAFQEVENA